MAVLLMLFASASSSAAHSEQSERHRDESPVSATAQPEPTDPKEVERFLDSFVPGQMEQHHVPGAAFVLVRDGEVLFSKGYGYANLEHKTLMSPDKTILRVWSVSKTFAFAVLMRHHEQESFGLDDVYEYLNDVRVDETYPEPVTFEHLLMHTDGFEDRTVGIGARSGDDLRLTKGLKWFGAGYLIYIGLKSLERITKYPLPLAYHNPDSAPGGFRR